VSRVRGDGWTVAEEQAVRAALAVGRDELDPAGPVPWADLAHRRARVRRRRVVVTAAGAAVAVLVGAGAVTGALDAAVGRRAAGVLPARTTGPDLGPGGPDTTTARTVGSLAGDDRFLDDLRRAVARSAAALGRTFDPADVRVLVAADVPGARVALVVQPDPDAPLQWFTGLKGSSGSRMTPADGCTAGAACRVFYGWGWTYMDDPRKDGGMALTPSMRGDGVVVAARPGSEVTVDGPVDVTADGTVRRYQAAAEERWPGVFVAPVPGTAPVVDVTVRPASGPVLQSTGSTHATDDLTTPNEWWADATTPADAPAARGNGVPMFTPAGHVQVDLLEQATQATGVPAAPGSRVLWAAHDESRWSAVLALRAASGGWAVVPVEVELAGGGVTYRTMAPRPLAVDAVDLAGFAWRRDTTGVQGGGDVGAVVVGPAGATGFRWADAAGRARGALVPLGPDGAAAPAQVPPGATRVLFLGPGGDEVASTEVEKQSDGLPGGVLLK
jgi:hypothetical protein